MAGQVPGRSGVRTPQRSARDERRRSFGQNFLVDRPLVDRIVASLDIHVGDLIVDIGAGRGALTFACAAVGARVIAIERDQAVVRQLMHRATTHRLAARIDVVAADFLQWPMPQQPFRVIANPPFGLTTPILDRLLSDPETGPARCDLMLQLDVARKRAHAPPDTLLSAAWSPWWTFELGPTIPRKAFRPIPRVDAALLTVRRRPVPVLPTWLARGFANTLRPVWDGGQRIR